ncbi:MAG: hypothetical protein U0800_13705 [Isosphaeraceae bacterium]
MKIARVLAPALALNIALLVAPLAATGRLGASVADPALALFLAIAWPLVLADAPTIGRGIAIDREGIATTNGPGGWPPGPGACSSPSSGPPCWNDRPEPSGRSDRPRSSGGPDARRGRPEVGGRGRSATASAPNRDRDRSSSGGSTASSATRRVRQPGRRLKAAGLLGASPAW